MPIKVLPLVLAFILPNYISIVSVARSNILTQPNIVYSTKVDQRPFEEKQENNSHQSLISSTKFKKLTSNEYDTSLTATNNIISNDLPVDTKINNYPMSMTDSHPFIDQDLYINNHNSYRSRDYHHNKIETKTDQLPEFSISHVNTIPKWIRYHHYVVSENDGQPNHDHIPLGPNTDDYELKYSENPKAGGDTVFSWYTDSTVYPPKPPKHVASVRRQGPKVTIDLQSLGMLALIKIALLKLKSLKALKVLLFLAIKLMMFTTIGVILSGKFLVLTQTVRLFLMPFAWSWLANAIKSFKTSVDGGTSIAAAESVNSSSISSGVAAQNSDFRNVMTVRDRFVDTGSLTATFVPRLARFVNTVEAASAQCVQTMACRAASSRSVSLESIWVNGVLSSLVDYIPNKKLKLYISTFQNVTISRLENMLNRSSTDGEWIKLCDEIYYCDDN